MNNKALEITFYVLAALLVVFCVTCAVFEAVIGTLPLWLAIVLSVNLVALFTTGTFIYVEKKKLSK